MHRGVVLNWVCCLVMVQEHCYYICIQKSMNKDKFLDAHRKKYGN